MTRDTSPHERVVTEMQKLWTGIGKHVHATVTLLCLVFVSLLNWGCSEDTPPRGELIVALSSDMPLPKDIGRLTIEVTVQGQRHYYNEHDLGENKLELPATLAIIEGTQANVPVTVTVAAWQTFSDRPPKLRLVRQAVTTMPSRRSVLLTLVLEWLCDGFGEVLPDPSGLTPRFSTGCAEGETCIAGACESNFVDPSSLPDYDPALVFGGGNGPGSSGMCFDTSACMDGALEVVPRWDAAASTCRIDRPDGDRVNVALVLPGGGDGICGTTRCLIVLDGFEARGFQPVSDGNAQLELPDRACALFTDGIITGVAVSTACPTKTTSVPLCGPWSSVDPGATGPLVEPPPAGGFSFYELTPQSLLPGEKLVLPIALERGNGFTSAVNVTLKNAPAGVTASDIVIRSSASQAALTLNASASARLGSFTPTIEASAGDLVKSLPFDLRVGGPNGSPDTSFGAGGAVVPPSSELSQIMLDVAVDAEDRILVAGQRGNKLIVTRYLAEGSLDSTFGIGGTRELGRGRADRIALLPDGKIVVAGYAQTDSGTDLGSMVVRFTAAQGAPDPTFGGGTGALVVENLAQATSLAVQEDGKILFGTWGGVLYRATAEGVLDATFGSNGQVQTGTQQVNDLHVFANGEILAVGRDAGGMRAVRVTSTGTLGPVLSGLPRETVEAIVVQRDGKILLKGNTALNESVLARFHANWSLDETFGTGGILSLGVNAGAYDADTALLSQGRILVVGTVGDQGTLVGVTSAGALDPSFGTGGTVTLGWTKSYDGMTLAKQSNGRIIVAINESTGSVASYRILRFWP